MRLWLRMLPAKGLAAAPELLQTTARAESIRAPQFLHNNRSRRFVAPSAVRRGHPISWGFSTYCSAATAGPPYTLPRYRLCCSCAAPMTARRLYTQQQQQQPTLEQSAVAAAMHVILQQPACDQHSTKLLSISPGTLPAVSSPDRATATAILTAPAVPELSPESCPHLYYNRGQQQQQQQQQQQDSASRTACNSSNTALQQAADLLRSGQPVAIPTETVYGLAANALSASAVTAVFAAKGRPSDNPLIVHISDLDMLAQLYPQQQQQQQSIHQPSSDGTSSSTCLSFLPKQYHRLIAAFWPGPLTLLLPASPLIPAAVTAGLSTVAVRMPAHPVARALIAAAGVPLAAPSANTSGRPSPTTAQHVMQDLAGRVAAVVDGGACACGVESTVLDGLRDPPVVLRPGGVTPELLAICPDMEGLQVYQRDFTDKQLEATPTTPGMKYRHYSPTAPMLLLDPTTAWQAQRQQQVAAVCEQQQSQQQVHGSLQQLVANATQQLLKDLVEAQQQQQQKCNAQEPQSTCGPARQRIVLLSTCSSDSSSLHVGWTEASLQLIQLQPGCSDLQPQSNGKAVQNTNSIMTISSSSGGGGSVDRCGLEVLEYVLGSWQQPEVVAQQLFAALRAADAVGPALIVAQGLPPEGQALAIMNRLQKAASQHVQVAGMSS